MLIFGILPISLSSNIFVDGLATGELITYFPKSLQLLDLENWFDYEPYGYNNALRNVRLTQRFVLKPYEQYTFVLNKEFLVDYDDFGYSNELFDNITMFETADYVIYTCIAKGNNDTVIDGKNYQVIDMFDFSVTTEYHNPDQSRLDYELSRLMILHEGLPKESYTLEDFKYKHPLDDTSPVFDGDTYFITNVNNPFTLEAILYHIVAYDEEDGFIDPVVIEDNYSANKNTIGSYTIKLEATDSSGNSSQLVITVLVVDVDVPEIIGPAELQTSISKKLSVEEIKSKYQVIDNYDTELVLSIIENDYLNNWNVVGRYKVVLKAVDFSGNETIREVYIKVIDDVAPVITGPTNIVKNNNEVLTISDIKALFTAVDNVDGDISDSLIIVEDGYTGFGHKVGQYKIILAVIDSSGNETRHELIIKVLDKIPPVFYIDNFLINVQSGVVLTKQQIVDLLIATGQLDANGITYVNFVLNEYEGNENVAGIYNVKLSAVSTDGSQKAFDLQVKVLEVEDNINPIIVETKNFFEKVWKHILSNWYWYLLGLVVLILILKRRSFRRY